MVFPAQPGAPSNVAAAFRATAPVRCRSFCFLERDGGRWTVFLITYQREDGQWRGYFSFRSAQGEAIDEIRTADLFVEGSEVDVDQRARGLGRPLLLALLESAVDTTERRRGYSPELHRWFRTLLAEHSASRDVQIASAARADASPTLSELRSLYESYRIDQVAHLIGLLDPGDFDEMVEVLLDGRRIDFRARDRFQLAMSIVQDLERRLCLPPFEVWSQDYLAHMDAYRRYSYALQRGEFLEE